MVTKYWAKERFKKLEHAEFLHSGWSDHPKIFSKRGLRGNRVARLKVNLDGHAEGLLHREWNQDRTLVAEE